jgi:hypothetical protein
MKIEVRLTEGKNIIDLALQHYGDAVAGIDLLMNDNPGVSVNTAFQAGEVIIIDEDKAANRAVRDYFAQRRISVNTGDVPVPATPTMLAAVTGADLGEIDLSWTDNATDEDSYELWRSTAPDSGFVVIATLPADTTTYADTGLANTTTYYYRLRARNAFASSPFTAVVSANTIGWVLRVAASNPSVLSFTKTGAPATYISAGGITEVFFTDAISTATEFIADDADNPDTNAGITGVLNLAAFTGLRTVRARNQSFAFVPGTWVRNANVVINLSNSLITAERTNNVINSVIIANGGTTTDNGTEYTGVPGETHANRQLIIGYIELDLTASENIITFQKVVALQSVGWTITTIKTLCLKSFAVDTVDTFFAVTSLEKTRRLFGLDYVSGAPLDIDLYETLPNASAGGSTGRLAQSYAGVNTWLLNDTNYNAWAEGDDNSKALRFFAADTLSTGNRSNLRYQAFPTALRACGAVQDVLGLKAFVAYGLKVVQTEYTGALIRLIRVSDNVQADFFPNGNGNLRWVDVDAAPASGETASITAWIGASTARVLTFYDQSGIDLTEISPGVPIKPTPYNATPTTSGRRPLLDVVNRGIRADAGDQNLVFNFGTAPLWLSRPHVNGGVVLSLVCRYKALGNPIGFGDPIRAGLVSVRNSDLNNIPISIATSPNTPNDTHQIRGIIGKGASNSFLETNMPTPSDYVVATIARNRDLAEFYLDDTKISEGVVTDFNEYSGTPNFGITVGNLTPSSNTRGNRNVPFSEIIIYQDKLTAEQVQQVSLFLNL